MRRALFVGLKLLGFLGKLLKRWKLSALLLLMTLSLTACGELGFNNWRWHQKMTIEVEVNGKTYTGSSVTSVHWWPNFFSGSWGGADWHSKVQGEAVVIELPNKKYLFALLSYSGNTEYTANLATRVLAKEPKHRVWGKNIFQAVLEQKGKALLIVSEDNYPLFVTFKDINDPASVQLVEPDQLATMFGSDIKLKRITLEITDELVTRGKVEKVLGWLDAHIGRIKPTTKRFEKDLTPEEKVFPRDFIKEIKKRLHLL